MSEIILEFKQVNHSFKQANHTLEILKQVNFSLFKGEVVGLVGPSGAGKSTLLQIAGLLESPTLGSVTLEGKECQNLDEKRRTLLRRQYLGFIYQFHHLLPEFTALENVMLPQIMNKKTKDAAKKVSQSLLEQIGLEHRLNHRPQNLSGGEQQRVAIARALANQPKLLLADEPTGNLDNATGDLVFTEMLRLARKTGLTVLMATHNQELAKRMDRVLCLREGRIEEW